MPIELYQEGLLELIDDAIRFRAPILEMRVKVLKLPKKGLATILVETGEVKGSPLYKPFELRVEKKFLKDISTTENEAVGYVYCLAIDVDPIRIIIKSPDCTPNEGWCTRFYPDGERVYYTDIKGDFFPEYKLRRG